MSREFLSLLNEVPYLVVQYLNESGYQEAAHKLEQQSGLFFDKNYLSEMVRDGKWDDIEVYISGFTKLDDNPISMMMLWHIRRQKYLEALDERNLVKATGIIEKDLKVFASNYQQMVEELTKLLVFDNFRRSQEFAKYGDTQWMRTHLVTELLKLIEMNPKLQNKLRFPEMSKKRLLNLINQGLNWQHHLCSPGKREPPEIKTLFTDHKCDTSVPDSLPAPPGFPALVAAQVTPAIGGPSTSRVAAPLNIISEEVESSSQIDLPPNPKRQMTTHAETSVVNVNPPNLGLGLGAMSLLGRAPNFNLLKDLPKTLVRTLELVQVPMSMDFHPVKQTSLLVGTNGGQLVLWEVNSGDRLFTEEFVIRELGSRSAILRDNLSRDPTVPVTRVIWNDDGALFGVASSKHIARIYSYNGGTQIQQLLEIEAHVGRVNDIGFAQPNDQLYFVTCGEDKTVKIWNVATGLLQNTFTGHDAPVTSICANKQHIMSASTNGNVKVIEYVSARCIQDLKVTNYRCMSIACSADSKSGDGNSSIFEMSENLETTRTLYEGLRRPSIDTVPFEIVGGRILAVGDDYSVKFWDVNSPLILERVKIEGKLAACPRLRSNREGVLMAVSSLGNSILILANAEGQMICPDVRKFSLRVKEERAETSGAAINLSIGMAPGEGSSALQNQPVERP